MSCYHYIYKLELLDENNVEIHNYFGKRSCSVNPEQDCRYMGSPKTAKEIIKNWPKERKKKIILEHHKNRISLGIAEEKIIRENIHDKPKNLNYAISGKNYYFTPEQLSEIGKKAYATALAKLTPEQRSENGKKGYESSLAKLTPEQLSEIGKKGGKKGYESSLAKLTPEQKSKIGKKGATKWLESSTPEERSEIAKKRATKWLESSTPEERSEIAKKGHITRKLKRMSANYTLETPQTKICSMCKKEKLFSQYNKKKDGKYNLSAECKECHNIKNKIYYYNKKEKLW